jgi:Uncharacterized conserved protein
MTTPEKIVITVTAQVGIQVEKAWKCWTEPQHITKWNAASDDWHTPWATNDLKVGGRFISRMEAKDGSFGFEFGGTYTEVEQNHLIAYIMDDERKVRVSFTPSENGTLITESFEAESKNSTELQQAGWQAILNNFKKYAEGLKAIVPTHFEISIDSPVEKVYKKMLDQKHFQEWTAAFNPTSRYEGSWEKGSKILFLGTDEQGNPGGMAGLVEENIPNQFVSINYYAIIQGGREITSGPELEGWAGTHEKYTFKAVGEKTALSVDLETNQEFVDYFNETYPKALELLKSICER